VNHVPVLASRPVRIAADYYALSRTDAGWPMFRSGAVADAGAFVRTLQTGVMFVGVNALLL